MLLEDLRELAIRVKGTEASGFLLEPPSAVERVRFISYVSGEPRSDEERLASLAVFQRMIEHYLSKWHDLAIPIAGTQAPEGKQYCLLLLPSQEEPAATQVGAAIVSRCQTPEQAREKLRLMRDAWDSASQSASAASDTPPS
jgi:hypothetical protein